MSNADLQMESTAGESQALVLQAICLDLKSKREAYEPALRKFLELHRASLDLTQANDVVATYLARAFPEGVATTVICSNASDNEYGAWLFRPMIGGPLDHQYAARGRAPVFHAYQKQGQLVVDSCMPAAHIAPRRHERVVTATFQANGTQAWMTKQDLGVLRGLPQVRKLTAQRLAESSAYLDWLEKLVGIRQAAARYDTFETAGPGMFHFVVPAAQLRNFRGAQKGVPIYTAPADASRSRTKWDPDPNNRPALIRVGVLVGTRAAGGGAGFVIVGSESEGGTLSPDLAPPDEGYLLASVNGEIQPLVNERRAIERLRRGLCANPYLPDFLMDIRNAGLPQDNRPEHAAPRASIALDEDQQLGVNKSRAAPDMATDQGPPGTGKTTMAAAFIVLAALAGERTLISSQTNLAIDNILLRLPEDPAIRPIRIAKVERITPEAQRFSEDVALLTWAGWVAKTCRANLQRNQDTEQRIQAAQESAVRLSEIAARDEALAAQSQELAARIHDLRDRQQAVSVELEQSIASADDLRRLSRFCEELAIWLADPSAVPPSAAGIGTSLPALTDMAERLRQEVPTQPWALPWRPTEAIASVEQAAHVIHSAAVAGLASAQMAGPIAEAIGMCDPDQTTAQMAELAPLVAQKGRLVDSDNPDDLLRLAEINRQIKSLVGQRWSGTCRTILQGLASVFGQEVPVDLDTLLARINPDPRWLAPFQTLASFAQVLSSSIGQVLASHREAGREEATSMRQSIEGQLADARGRIEQVQATLRQASAAIDDLRGQQETLNNEVASLAGQWQQEWVAAVPAEGRNGQDAPAISRAVAADRRQHLQDWLDRTRHQRERSQIWRQVQETWLQQLGNPTAVDRAELRSLYIANANVVGATCNETGRPDFHSQPCFQEFDTVIIDEVSKATPTELLMAMLLGRKIVLVGDHRQLPPMFREHEASFAEAMAEGLIAKEDFERYRKLVTASFFEELFQAASEALRHSLLRQYRMHPQIMAVINQFYDGKLVSANGDAAMSARCQHNLRIRDNNGGWLLEPSQHVLWIDSSRDAAGRPVSEVTRGSSKANLLEVDLVLAMLLRLNTALAAQGFGPNGHGTQAAFRRMPIGVITFYGAQLGEIRRRIGHVLEHRPGQLASLDIHSNTVDRFQGMERSIILVSLVRSRGHLPVGDFVKQYQRINVAFSRAQSLLVIIGSAVTFGQATVDLPGMNGGPARSVRVYDSIHNLVSQFGGRRYARQLL